jgi:hypothetical protein
LAGAGNQKRGLALKPLNLIGKLPHPLIIKQKQESTGSKKKEELYHDVFESIV